MTAADPPAERVELARRVRLSTLLAAGAANVVGGVVVATYLVLLSPGDAPRGFKAGETLLVAAAYLVVALPLGDRLSRRLAGGFQEPLLRGERLSARQRRNLVGVPWRAALITFGLWLLAAVLFTAYYGLRYDDTADKVARVGLTVGLGGLTTSALVFLLNEGPLRAVYAVAFSTDPPARAEGLAVRLRLVLAWVLGGGVPLLGIALAFLGTEADDHSTLLRGILSLVAVGLVAGCAITLQMAHSVAEPLRRMRGELDRVRRGDLEAHVDVDDVTEIGLLQAGFNEMVAGLRERAHLEDLFGRHVGPDVAREALRRGVELGGERREASALFVDLVGSTQLAATRAPEEVVSLLNDVFEAVVDAATSEGGLVNKFEGDAALCVFGAPVPAEDHAARALRAARRLRAELDRLAERHPGLDAGIGVSSGTVVAGNVGAEERYEYTVIGDPVNEAARLTEEAKSRPGRVLASSQAVERAGNDAAGWREAGTLRLRGRASETLAWEPDSAVPHPGPLPSRAR